MFEADAAGRIFRRLGFRGGGVDAVMAEAGLTAGGFYAHFKNKDALFSEFIRYDMEQLSKRRYADRARFSGREWVLESLRRYLSQRHFKNIKRCRAGSKGRERVLKTVFDHLANTIGDWRHRDA